MSRLCFSLLLFSSCHHVLCHLSALARMGLILSLASTLLVITVSPAARRAIACACTASSSSTTAILSLNALRPGSPTPAGSSATAANPSTLSSSVTYPASSATSPASSSRHEFVCLSMTFESLLALAGHFCSFLVCVAFFFGSFTDFIAISYPELVVTRRSEWLRSILGLSAPLKFLLLLGVLFFSLSASSSVYNWGIGSM